MKNRLLRHSKLPVLAAMLLVGLAAQSQEIQIAKTSPLYALSQKYLPTAVKSYEETYRRHHSGQVVSGGWEAFKQKDYAKALETFFLAINMDYKNPSAYFGVAYVCSIQNNLTDAITFYREALKYETNYSPIYANLAKALLIKNKNVSEEAPKLLDKAIQVDPKNGDAYLTYASYRSERGEWKLAGEMAEKALECGAHLPPEAVQEFKAHGINLRTTK